MRVALSLLQFACVLLAVSFALSFAARWHFMLDNLSSFRLHFLLAFLVCGVVFVLARNWYWSGVALAGTIVSLTQIVPWYLPSEPVTLSAESKSIKVMTANVLLRNTDYDRFIQAVTKIDPDVLGLVEVNSEWVTALYGLREDFPHTFAAPDEGFRGFALYSKYPIQNAVVETSEDGSPWGISAILQVEQEGIAFMLVHPAPPMSSLLADQRNRQLETIARAAHSIPGPKIVGGDLNISMWSPQYDRFVEDAGLANARQGFGVSGTWPPSRLFGVPIDHLLYSGNLDVVKFEVLDNFGSDHLPILAQMVVNSPARAASTLTDN